MIEQALFVLMLIALIVWVKRKARRWAKASPIPPVNLRSGRLVDPLAPLTPTESERFRTIRRRRGLPGLAAGGVVYLIVAAAAVTILTLVIEDAQPHEVGTVGIVYGFLAALLTYGGRLVLSRCPRCEHRLIGWWALLWVAYFSRLGWPLWRKFNPPRFDRCPHCGTVMT